MTREEFIAAATAAAEKSAAASGLLAGVTVAQAALESSWGRSQLSTRANNYFGIKAHGDAKSIELPTWECVNGERICIAARFARYDTMEECFRERDAIILRLACYAEARAAVHDAEAFMRALAKHWATDPKYGDKLLAVWRGLTAQPERPSVVNLDACSRSTS